MSGTRQRPFGGGSHYVLDYLKRMQAENSAFFYKVQVDNDHAGGNIFWVDGTCRMNYSYFGDAVILDTTYKTKRYKVPFASFTGFNHHGQPVLFGCALILNESESSFIWLFRTWLQAMSGRHPVSITSDLDPFIRVAVAQVLPQTRHRFGKWGIFRETREKLVHLCQSHPAFEPEFNKCVNESETIDEFESSWESLLNRYYIMDNEWLQSLYSARQRWVPVYLRDTFFAEISLNEGNECLNIFFDGYVNASTTIQMLVKQYEKAVSAWHERELKADYDTTNISPVLKTPSPMEKQAASLYTRKIFMKFQEELVETLANPATKTNESGALITFRVAKFGENQKAHVVTFDSFEMKASCSCQMFEYSGIICRHILAVFRAKNVLTLPPQYVLKRWTRNAKVGALLGEHASECTSNSHQSLTVRYNNLRQEAIKYVEEGAKSIHIYHIAMKYLQEAAKKVSSVKDQNAGTTEGAAPAERGRGGMLAADVDELPTYTSVEEKQKKIKKLTAELRSTNQRCEVYRANLLAVLRDMEEQKLKLSVKVQNARLSLKE
ncbi:protein FAR1-RELATED SEQUENCE 9 isoform X1 [Prosopis cineraria]|uniref:protein FAR1-RELATED SEQUENCE 9 isoform X1 n=1 Tax=Prosopis cineraria TaxID=364024 RepID=UPI00240F627F|nr:protein FAR1-RELATED SEQUENCE 9 isoform X1 [Prosopis cineraria]